MKSHSLPLKKLFALLFFVFACCDNLAESGEIQQALSRRPVAELIAKAAERGDPARGAVLFHQKAMACTKCHGTTGEQGVLGPDLTKLAKDKTNEHLVESILQPSKVVEEKFRSKTIYLQNGKIVVGMPIERNEQQVKIREASGNLETLVIPLDQIDEVEDNTTSLMPEGLVDQLRDEAEFYDLVRYLMEIRDGGSERAAQLQPAPELYAVQQLPAYESNVDHAALISALDKKSFERGAKIYLRVCANCHGTNEAPGSLPTSLRFGSGQFKHGNDPYKMYQTLTHGYGLMVPQAWMVPKQKYDVIHYIRESFLKRHNQDQYFDITDDYLKQLPPGTTLGPEPVDYEPWVAMNYGPNINLTMEVGSDASNLAYKGIAVRLNPGTGGVSRGNHWMLYEHDTMRAAAGWSGREFIDWNSIHFNGRHAIHPRLMGDVTFQSKGTPGWANPADGTFDDLRLRGRDNRAYGPLPRDWAHYRGIYHHGQNVIVSYTIGTTDVLEMPSLTNDSNNSEQSPVFLRVFNIGPREKPLTVKIADLDKAEAAEVLHTDDETSRDDAFAVGEQLFGMAGAADARLKFGEQQVLLTIPAGKEPLQLVAWIAKEPRGDNRAALAAKAGPMASAALIDLSTYTQGGPARWTQKLKTQPKLGSDEGPFAQDDLMPPTNNPWHAQMRLTGLDFFEDSNRMAVCSWDGDVWLVEGLDDLAGGLTWQRIASGMFQPLGLKIVDGKIFVTCRDALYRLHDLNGDGETDYYESYNSDHQVTEHFHEFAMGLQTDAEGNFYYAKSARHAKTPLVPHHGTLLKISKDGSQTEIIANGFRAANGVCINPDGTFIVTDQEGHWNPKNRINWVKPGGFYGNMWSYTDVTDESDEAMELPLCWITNSFDRSPAELLWVESKQWGPLGGSLLNLSYGYGKVFVVPHEEIDGQKQGGMCELPGAQFPTGVHRGRFHPKDGQLYLCGMFAWAGNATQRGGLYRLRYTGHPAHLPIGLKAKQDGLEITLTDPVTKESAEEVSNYQVKAWDLKRTKNYGSPHFNEHALKITRATLGEDGRTIKLTMPEIAPTWCMEVQMKLQDAGGNTVARTIHNTIHALGK